MKFFFWYVYGNYIECFCERFGNDFVVKLPTLHLVHEPWQLNWIFRSRWKPTQYTTLSNVIFLPRYCYSWDGNKVWGIALAGKAQARRRGDGETDQSDRWWVGGKTLRCAEHSPRPQVKWQGVIQNNLTQDGGGIIDTHYPPDSNSAG